MNSKRILLVLATALILSAAGSAPLFAAALPPAPLSTEVGLILASGEEALAERPTVPDAPARTRDAWRRFRELEGRSWHGYFDATTGAPGRIWGEGIQLVGAMKSPEVAEAGAREMIARHVDLFAPGAHAEDFELVSNHTDGAMRTLGFVQKHRGLRVFGGQVSFRYKNDRLFMIGSEAFSDVSIEAVAHPVSNDTALRAASQWIETELRTTPDLEGVKGMWILPIRARARLYYQQVLEVRARTARPTGYYAVYLDAASAAPVARRQLLMFTSGTVSFNTPIRWPGSMRVDRGVSDLSLTLNGAHAVTDAVGRVSWMTADPVMVTLGVTGPRVTIANQAGIATSTTTMLQPSGRFVWNEAMNELADAQLISYVASEDVKAYVRNITPNMPWLDEQLTVNVNINDICNAFSDGNTTNFFKSGMGCENTGRLPDVVDHESGHTIHFHAIIDGVGNFDTALSEGVSDYLSATMHDDPQMGRGFFFTNEPLRDLDPAGIEKKWPDDISRDPHETGRIIGGALWDLRKSYVAMMGHDAGVVALDRLWYSILQRAADIPSTYAEAIAFDDDDGNLMNGTPHLCLINAAFSPHGLVDKVNAGPGIGVPGLDRDTLTVSFPFHPHDMCPGSKVLSAKIDWWLRDAPDMKGTVDMVIAADGASFAGMLPRPSTPKVVRYQVTMSFDDGSTLSFPDNAADPSYEIFIGDLVPLYCTDFEMDPANDGWTHSLEASTPGRIVPVDDWQWGPPMAIPGSGDPAYTYSGEKVVGNDLGQGMRADGRYQSNSTTALVSPPIDVKGHTDVHLQYRRWLTIEDGVNDQALIYGGSTVLWKNLASPMASDPLLQTLVNHVDKEWRFQDVDLSSTIENGQVSVKWELTANRRRTLGGWTIDDVCVVAVPVCGDGKMEGGEACDDGNTNDGDGCTGACTIGMVAPVCGNGMVEDGEACDDGAANGGDHCTAMCTLGPAMMNMMNPGTNPDPNAMLAKSKNGCGCSASAGSAGSPYAALALLFAALVIARRRSRG
jgi:MYXO-CTERM domain-containing protein